ncbi:hypothetical protein JCM19301_3156 [Jejuia pallidilutea]|uniref:Uncharacterized protein n=1 Tax=Jejuia pallidilutea TaxID=504487 RepID=A0A090VRP5_9FLAO|nr:hypothetical protein JCM19301_3156 [Jejuia pallidilutea]GAL90950.1 hypothetical protein JCM19538_1008 [Jejuia pallidilutea]
MHASPKANATIPHAHICQKQFLGCLSFIFVKAGVKVYSHLHIKIIQIILYICTQL